MSSISSSSISLSEADYDGDYSVESSVSEEEVSAKRTTVVAPTPKVAVMKRDPDAEAERMVRHRGETENVFNYRKEVYRRIRTQTELSPLDCVMYAMMIVKYVTESCLPSESDLKQMEELARTCGIEI